MQKGFTLIEVLVLVGILGVIVAVIVGVVGGRSEEQRLMRQCMNDGKKEYECRVIIEQGNYHSSTLVITQ